MRCLHRQSIIRLLILVPCLAATVPVSALAQQTGINSLPGTDLYLAAGNSATPFMTIGTTGFVGIGTIAPQSTLDVYNGQITNHNTSWGYGLAIYSNGQANNYFSIGQGWNTAGDNIGFIDNTANAAIYFATNAAQRMMIAADGDIGIGVTAPQALLDVNGVMRSFGYASRSGVSGAYTGNHFNIYWNGTCAHLYIDVTDLGCISALPTLYSCPVSTNAGAGGSWASFGCVGQVSISSTCTNWVFNGGLRVAFTGACTPIN